MAWVRLTPLLLLLCGQAFALSKPTGSADIQFEEGSAVLSAQALVQADFVVRWFNNPRLCPGTLVVSSELNDVDLTDPTFTALVAARIIAVRDHLVRLIPADTEVFAEPTRTRGAERVSGARGVVSVEAQAWLKGAEGRCLSR
jgi:hypothetical protein